MAESIDKARVTDDLLLESFGYKPGWSMSCDSVLTYRMFANVGLFYPHRRAQTVLFKMGHDRLCLQRPDMVLQLSDRDDNHDGDAYL